MITYEISSEEYMVAVAKALGLPEDGIASLMIDARVGKPLIIELKYIAVPDQRLLSVSIPRIPKDER